MTLSFSKYSGIRVTHVADAVDRFGPDHGAGAGGMMLLGASDACFIGPAYTVQQQALPARRTDVPLRHGEAITKLSEPGDIVVIDVQGDVDVATWGEAHAMKAMARKLTGVLVNGGTRDIATLRALPFPSLVAGVSPFKSLGRIQTVEVGGDVVVRGVHIRTGDIMVIGDEGFMCLPANTSIAVLDVALEIAQRETARDIELRAALETKTS